MKEFFYFILILYMPVALSDLIVSVFNIEDEDMRDAIKGLAFLFFILYITFPKIYRKDAPKKFLGKCTVYFLEYSVFFIGGVLFLIIWWLIFTLLYK